MNHWPRSSWILERIRKGGTNSSRVVRVRTIGARLLARQLSPAYIAPSSEIMCTASLSLLLKDTCGGVVVVVKCKTRANNALPSRASP